MQLYDGFLLYDFEKVMIIMMFQLCLIDFFFVIEGTGITLIKS